MTTAQSPLNLDPIYIPGLIEDVKTDGVVGGVNYHMIHANDAGLLIQVQTYLNMQEGDWIEVFWGTDPSPVASDLVMEEHVGRPFGLFVRANRIPEGVHDLWCTVTRSGGGNGGESPPIAILVRTEMPGDTDPEPDAPGHQNLLPPEPDIDFIDEDAAKNGVKVTIPGYPNLRVFDTITLSWGGELLQHEVTQTEVDAGSVEILVSEETILAAGDSDALVLVYRVIDEVHNPSSDWSMRTYVIVEIGKDLFIAPVIVNPDPAADPFDVIDLEALGDDDLLIEVYAESSGPLRAGDVVALTWIGTTAQGLPVVVEPPPLTVTRIPSRLDFAIANDAARQLAGGRGAAAYTVTRDDSPVGASKRSFVSFLGMEQRLPKPTVPDAIGGILDPSLEQTLAIVPGEVLEANDTVTLVWLGTRANGTPLLHQVVRGVTPGNAGKPMSFTIPGDEFIAPLDGGTLSVYYQLFKASGVELESEREPLSIGEPRADLPAPGTRPAAENGLLDPEDVTGDLEIVIAPWPDMRAGQTVHLLWQASSGPNLNDSLRISEPLEGQEVVFTLDRTRLEENRGATVEISYRVESPDEPTQVSDTHAFAVGVRQIPLPLPQILEADDDHLDPNDVLQGATVQIAAKIDVAQGDLVTVVIVSSAEDGSTRISHPVAPDEAGQAVTVTVPHGVIAASVGTRIELHYEVTRAAGGVVETSATVEYSVYSELDAGAFRVMGARYSASVWWAGYTPRMLSALAEDSLAPMLVEWRYEDSQQWRASTTWNDDKPWLKLYARSASQTWECRAANVVGNGFPHMSAGYTAFAALHDQDASDSGTDIVVWGDQELGGVLEPGQLDPDSVLEVSGTAYAFAARLNDGNIACWGHRQFGGEPSLITGDFVQVRSSRLGFVARRSNGELLGWGTDADLPKPIQQHKDYVEVYAASLAFAARRATGQVVAWGDESDGGTLNPGQGQLNDIVHVVGNQYAFAAIREHAGSRSVIAWGSVNGGGVVPENIAVLTNVRSLVAAGSAFCVLLDSGEVRAWPDNVVGNIPEAIEQLTNVVEVSGTLHAFCARLSTGHVVAWGDHGSGGKLSAEAAEASDIVQVTTNLWAFAALRRDGTVLAWGNNGAGGNTRPVAGKLVDVRAIYGNPQAFTALTADGRVVTWGIAQGGGNSDKVQPELHGKVTHSRLLTAAEAEAVDRN